LAPQDLGRRACRDLRRTEETLGGHQEKENGPRVILVSFMEDTMVTPRLGDRPLLLGCVFGLVFGIVDLLFTWVEPLSDDSIPALLRFYGPMFFAWAFVAFRAVRRRGRLSTGVTTGVVVAIGTFCVFYVLNLVRVNLFLVELTGRADWQNMMQRFRASEFDNLRSFVNVDYLKGAPFKIGVASVIGAVMGLVGGTIGRLRSARLLASA
jgi:hypothetical protein